jgi:hypothetical protein
LGMNCHNEDVDSLWIHCGINVDSNVDSLWNQYNTH